MTATEERELLQQDGHPFPDAKAQLERCDSSRTKGKIQSALVDLRDRPEIAERYGDGELDVW